MTYDTISIVANKSAVLKSSLFMARKAWKSPARGGHENIKDRFFDAISPFFSKFAIVQSRFKFTFF